ncbi:MAG TPA: glycosyltransferase family 2 protein [Bryobacteraceae bacterium]|nr:glycosyltransferase family 2 protein [Bryobacteraceae bacterium]
MMKNHISVCVCTYKRPELLRRLLSTLVEQVDRGAFSYSVVIADNDQGESARAVVTELSPVAPFKVEYCVEPRQNIALVRNKAVAAARGEYIAFIDDDEYPGPQWLLRLWTACQDPDVHGVLGPVIPYFETDPPEWVKKGKFFDRPNPATGRRLNWTECRTGNVLFRRSIIPAGEAPFRAEFGSGGEDTDFFWRMTADGARFIWNREAPVYELVPAARCRKTFLLKRALLRGSNFQKYPADRLKNAAKSILAVPAYAIALPILAAAGEHLFLKYLIKLFDHTARLLSFAGVTLASERES